jgi:flagellin-like protein
MIQYLRQSLDNYYINGFRVKLYRDKFGALYMKKIFRFDEKAVSPVIAVILMVAVTVVLAGVVFLWAQSFTEYAVDDVSFFQVDVTVRTDEGTPPNQELEVLMLKGKVDWARYEVHFEDIQLAGSTAVTTAGSSEVFTVPDSTSGGYDLEISNKYNIRIVSIDSMEIVYIGDSVCISM